jgi:hypothetical protein
MKLINRAWRLEECEFNQVLAKREKGDGEGSQMELRVSVGDVDLWRCYSLDRLSCLEKGHD